MPQVQGLRVGDRLRLHPDREALMLFGREVCGVASAAASIEKITDAMEAALHAADLDDRIPKSMLKQMSAEWRDSISMYHLRLPARSGSAASRTWLWR